MITQEQYSDASHDKHFHMNQLDCNISVSSIQHETALVDARQVAHQHFIEVSNEEDGSVALNEDTQQSWINNKGSKEQALLELKNQSLQSMLSRNAADSSSLLQTPGFHQQTLS